MLRHRNILQVWNCLNFRISEHSINLSRLIRTKPCLKRLFSTNFTSDAPSGRWEFKRSDVESRGFHITTATVEDREKILELLQRSFLLDEPLVLAAGLGGTPSTELQEDCVDCLRENLTLMAMSFSGDILGVALNSTSTPNPEPNICDDKSLKCKCDKTSRLYRFYSHLEREAKLFRLYDVSHALELRVLATDPDERGKGISKALTDSSLELARVMNYPLMRIDCTSHYSALIAEKLGFDCVYSLDYKDYKGDDGNPVFCPKPPHYSAKIYARGLNV